MESINEIIDSQTFCQQLDETTEFITVGPGRPDEGGEGGGQSNERELLSNAMRKLIGGPTAHDDCRINSPDDETRSVVMVIDEMQSHNNVQTTYQVVQQQPLQLQSERTLPLSTLLPLHQNHRHDRLVVNSSPVDFVGTDLSLDGLAVSTSSHIVPVKDEDEHKLVIVHRGENSGISINNQTSSRNDISRMSNINVIDEISSDGGEEVTLNQHHQQLLEDQHQHYNHHLQQHHQQYGHRLIHHQDHQQQRHQPQRTVQLAISQQNALGHRESLSVIVQTQVDVDVDEEEEDVDDDDDDNDDSPLALGSIDNSLEHSTYQTLTSVNNNHRISPPPFSPTSYATLTPIQPLPPISTMSDKFAYTGHISGSVRSSSVNGNNSSITNCRINGGGSADGSSSDCASFTSLPLAIPQQSGSLANLSLSGLGGVQSPYPPSPYDKLPSLISPPPPHSYAQSPSHGITGIIGSSSPVEQIATACEELSPQRDSSLRTSGNNHNNQHADHQTMHEICLSPAGAPGTGEGSVVSEYESSSYSTTHASHELLMATTSSTSITSNPSSQSRSRLQQLQQSPPPPMLSPHSVSTGGSVMSMSLHSPPHMNGGTVSNMSVELPVVVALSPTLSPLPPAPPNDVSSISIAICGQDQNQGLEHQQQVLQAGIKNTDCNTNNGLIMTNIPSNSNLNVCINQQQQRHQPNESLSDQLHQQQSKLSTTSSSSSGVTSRTGANINDMEEINTKELAQRISAELKRYSIPQAIFAQRVLCRSQGTLSDLLRNPKPWSKLKSGRETFRRMFKWLQEPEFQRMSALRLAAAQIPQRPSTAMASTGSACNVVPSTGSNTAPASSSSTVAHTVFLPAPNISSSSKYRKLTRLTIINVNFCLLQETKRPSKEMQVTIARQLGLEPTTVGNFFMNARRRSMDKWRDDDIKNNIQQMHNNRQLDESDERETNILEQSSLEHYENLHTTAMSPLGNFDDDGEMDLDLENHDFLVDENDEDDQDDML
ncbi:hypothetical protein KR093_010967 [Drosophila rubida]|uniref:CUT domain-containing protein n=1 Tax=Drosophila rubida TaxID=30044 RepID=A0AAD4K303_9MUSC|nr:hypothetical protein KR093_010967 [Drosophila rubida]